MAKLTLRLTRNLRRSVLRGHPWIYREALATPPPVDRAQLARVQDVKGALAWAMYDPNGPLALRILSLDEAPPGKAFFEKRFARALNLRDSLIRGNTGSFRLFNGEGDLLPGLVCDLYRDCLGGDTAVAVLQFDGEGPGQFWDREWIGQWLIAHAPCQTVIFKPRGSSEQKNVVLAGPACEAVVEVSENQARFKVNLEKGQKTGFFLDQRDNREFVRSKAAGKSVLNLFSYTGGFSMYAGLGGAHRVASVDIAQGAIDLATENWVLNGLEPGRHEGICADVFEYIEKCPPKSWDHVIVDPPSMTHSEAQKATAIAKYTELFASAARKVKSGGELSLSSCSSHVHFDDFALLIDEALSSARRTGQILRVSGQGIDHPFPAACPEMRYLKFVHLILD